MYYSPLHIIGINASWNTARLPERKDVLMARKKCLAELELSEDQTITINGKTLEKQDIIAVFDELNNEIVFAYHLAIFKDETLLAFLEEGELKKGKFWNDNLLYDDPYFISFISPYFAEAYDRLISLLIRQAAQDMAPAGFDQQYKNAAPAIYRTLRRNKQMLFPVHREQAFAYAHRFFIEKKNELLLLHHRIAEETYAEEDVKAEHISQWCSDQAILLLNELPEDFNSVRHALASELNNLCVTCNEQIKLRIAYTVILKADIVEIDDDSLKEIIKRNIAVIHYRLQGDVNVRYKEAEHKKDENNADKRTVDTPDTNEDVNHINPRLIILLLLLLVLYIAYRASQIISGS